MGLQMRDRERPMRILHPLLLPRRVDLEQLLAFNTHMNDVTCKA